MNAIRWTERDADGGWIFEIDGIRYKAWHNDAGFAGRDWELWRWEPAVGRWVMVVDQIDTRAACVLWASEDAPIRVRAARNRERARQEISA